MTLGAWTHQGSEWNGEGRRRKGNGGKAEQNRAQVSEGKLRERNEEE